MDNSLTRTQPREPKAMIAVLCSIFLISSGCTTTRSFTSADAIQDDLRPGDEVTLVLKDGRELELSVTEWSGERLTGLDRAGLAHSVASQDIAHADVTRNSPMKTVLLLVSIASIALAIAAAATYGDLLSGPILL